MTGGRVKRNETRRGHSPSSCLYILSDYFHSDVQNTNKRQNEHNINCVHKKNPQISVLMYCIWLTN